MGGNTALRGNGQPSYFEGRVDVASTIHAKEVKVDLTGWSDFVFHPAYKLKPLTEVDQYIKTNGHLENIPSAEQVEHNGVNVGEMQAKLLEKVEELTLYSIEQEKARAKLEVIVEVQAKKNLELEQKLVEQDNAKVEIKGKATNQEKINAEQAKQINELQLKLLEQSKQIEQLKLLITQKLKP